MEQKAIVRRILPGGEAEISLLRQTECGLGCKSCDGCPQRTKGELLALADNALGAAAGAVVTVRPNRCGSVWAAVLVFLLPCVGLIGGWLLAHRLSFSQGVSILSAFFGASAGFIPAVLVNCVVSKKHLPEFTITSLKG